MGLWSTKSIASLQADPPIAGGDTPFNRTLGPADLCLVGLGAIIGAGIFIRTGTASAQYAGPAIVLSFLVAGLGCLFVGLCYAEFASMIPVAGGTYTYCYAAFGEFLGWVIGWDLILEYTLGGATVAVSWSAYFVAFLEDFGVTLPASLTHAPFAVESGWRIHRVSGSMVNLPAMAFVLLVTAVLCVGIRPSAIANRAVVALKVSIALVVIGFGFLHLDPANWQPFVPPNAGSFGRFGWSGVFQGATAVFFAFIGFDAIASLSQEARRPQRDVPIAILGSLAICTALYVLMALVMTGLARYPDLNAPHPLIIAVSAAEPSARWLTQLIHVAILAGLASVSFVLLLGQPRILYAMSRDGLLPKAVGAVHSRFKTPVVATLVTGAVAAGVAGFFPVGLLLEGVALATLLAFVAVCAGVLVLRYRDPNARRPFRAWVPVVPVLGIVFSVATMLSVPSDSWSRVLVWNVLGIALYFVLRRRAAAGVH
jgi:APA family basic amino acid/polyamine antiporter